MRRARRRARALADGSGGRSSRWRRGTVTSVPRSRRTVTPRPGLGRFVPEAVYSELIDVTWWRPASMTTARSPGRNATPARKVSGLTHRTSAPFHRSRSTTSPPQDRKSGGHGPCNTRRSDEPFPHLVATAVSASFGTAQRVSSLRGLPRWHAVQRNSRCRASSCKRSALQTSGPRSVLPWRDLQVAVTGACSLVRRGPIFD
jgi:hypothetical protein